MVSKGSNAVLSYLDYFLMSFHWVSVMFHFIVTTVQDKTKTGTSISFHFTFRGGVLSGE